MKYAWSILPLIVLLIISTFSHINPLVAAVAVLFLGIAVMTAVHHAEVIAERVGASLGALVLALSVTVIEVGLIVAMMTNDTPDSAVVARDTIFATIIIVTNGIMGCCLLLGGMRHKELSFHQGGTSSLLTVLAILSGLTLVMPNFTTSTVGPTYTNVQLIFTSIGSLILYGCLVWSQTKSHKEYYEPVLEAEGQHHFNTSEPEEKHTPTNKEVITSFIGLMLSLAAVIGLSKALSPSIESGVDFFGAPRAFVGIVIALLVLAPETWAAISSARSNRLQTSLNLALGSGAASIALTIPVVGIFSIMTDRSLVLGVDPKGIAFLTLTFILAGLTLGRGRTTALQGIVHLSLMLAFLIFSFAP